MITRPESDETLVKRLMPSFNPDPADRALAWREWYVNVGEMSVLAFVKVKNDTSEPDMDIFQEAMTTAFVEVERGNYKPCLGVPLTAYVKGIARNKIREARRHKRRSMRLEEALQNLSEKASPHLETLIEWQERWDVLQVGLSALTPSRRQVLQGYLKGHSTAEIANALGITEDLVRQHKSRGLRSLRHSLQGLDVFSLYRQ